MASRCCVPLCSNDRRYPQRFISNNIKRKSFHKFPIDEKMKKEWLVHIKRDEGPLFKVSKFTVICSAHFKDNDYNKSSIGLATNILKPSAVPSIFSWSKAKNHRKPPLQRNGKSAMAETMKYNTGTGNETNIVTPIPSQDHDYLKSDDMPLEVKVKHLQDHVEKLEEKIQKMSVERFGLERFTTNSKLIKFYTGFYNYDVLIHFYHCLAPRITGLVTWAQVQRHKSLKSSGYVNAAQMQQSFGGKLQPIDQFFMFLHKLRLGSMDHDLADKFSVSQSTVSRNTITWSNFLYFVLASQPIWPTKDEIIMFMPAAMRETFPKIRVIIDCTEITVQSPSSFVLNSEFFSNYKGRTTLKCLIGITPRGAVCFVSNLYTGSISDKALTQECGILDLLEEGDEVMADKGFLIKEMLESKKCKLVMPHFLHKNKQFSKQQALENKAISNIRVHVERAIRRCKEFHLFDSDLPLNLLGTINQLWSVACLLTNFQRPLIAAD